HPHPDFGPHFGQSGYGRAFLAEHKQMINDFDVWRDTVASLGRIETWDPNPFPP
ncbi:MAG: hypothetical protein GWO03_11170, partial [Gammaproteobacteria bacterium]|nr:hypothetical protein [Gammaproteobacteria bacterium]